MYHSYLIACVAVTADIHTPVSRNLVTHRDISLIFLLNHHWLLRSPTPHPASGSPPGYRPECGEN